MKKLVMSVLISIFLLTSLISCEDSKRIDGVTYDTYGLLNEDLNKNPDIAYEPIWGNIILGVILVETIIAPVYFFGFSLFEPIRKKPAIKGTIPE